MKPLTPRPMICLLWDVLCEIVEDLFYFFRAIPFRVSPGPDDPNEPEPWMKEALDSLLRKIERDPRFQFLPCRIGGEASGVIALRDTKNGVLRFCPVFVMITPGMKFNTMGEPAGNA